MFRWEDCVEGHIILGLTFSLISSILLTLVTFSTPYNKSIYFLRTPNPSIHFGALGYCPPTSECIKRVGYSTGSEVTEWLTRAQVLYAVGAIFMLLALIALLLSLLRVGQFMWNPIYFRTMSLLGFIFSLLAEIFALILWVQARHRYDAEGVRATYGAALWIGLAGLILAFLARSTVHYQSGMQVDGCSASECPV
ncbi:hypothetical protein TREMEDRAFT_66360 [Tremella mesenterica DSM 1558]|uniref:uncharacterized protein n=1 Tax=Tremella mesenterica (strain ATCC 24925 / CBS 8224 / DSM 1558 / NBRC 9311 / NRRL Y-6157 / RJB 2259-6 / UBC 559-6) TaxID=578456 RepID=UPI00032BD9F6|nr:uncharacterized protein TREMEDRAFT_66360 [Tremella mesenterica DSM 1558]EIW65637.1 hypothetical protein TREMEDRAFT_66360 [Tremella mesenterica DSM 1558]